MKVTALVDVCVKGKSYAKGDVLDVSDGAAAVLISHGWATEEPVKAPAKKARKKKEVKSGDAS